MQIKLGLTTLAVAMGLALAPAAHADDVRTQSGPGASTDDAFVTYVSCGGFFGPSTAPQTRINLGPGVAPLGRRSLGLVPGGSGTAAGPFARFPSLASLDAGVSVSAGAGTSGVSYIWAITPDVRPGTAWSGRAETAVPAGGWHPVEARALRYEWTLVHLGTQEPVAVGGAATPGQFSAAHGDGHGYVVTGFGCDGAGFNIDAVRAQGSTIDFEGIALSTTIDGPTEAAPGTSVKVTGTARDAAGRTTGDPLVLETRAPGGAWKAQGEPVLAGPDGVTRVEVPVSETTELRWHRPESQYADEGWSDVITVQVAAVQEEPAHQEAAPDRPEAEKSSQEKSSQEKSAQ